MQDLKCAKLCKHYKGYLSCDAYPNRIPNEILLGKDKHTKPLPDQKNGIVFEEKK